MNRRIAVLVALLWLSLELPLAAQPNTGPQPDQAQNAEAPRRRVNPALRPIQDDPALPRVLLLGDSISIGYTLPVRKQLAGQANVHRPAANCGPTTRGLESIDAWLGDKPWDVIHFNWGLHDLKYLGTDGRNLADPKDPGSHQQVPIEQYEKNLRELVDRLRQTGATLIWRSTTPVPEGARGRVVGDARRYNRVAEKIMREHAIAIDDMYAYSLPKLQEIQRPANVHFTNEGSEWLAARVAAAIKSALRQRAAAGKESP